jgi:uncharacterized repeat protein (TIGR03803 family)
MFRTVYAFQGNPDGANPSAALIDVNGTLYGTTAYGGVGGIDGYGTCFKVTESGLESVLYSFKGPDGAVPRGRLIEVNGTLYGTTWAGGANGWGSVFAITPAGKETVLHSFAEGGSDGFGPETGLVDVNGILYGTTASGGTSGGGTVFSITPSGKETILHSFDNSQTSNDGSEPEGRLIDVQGTLYGTTLQGGEHGGGSGVVYKITPSGTETVLYRFRGSQYLDGAAPRAGLTNVNGLLYGTAVSGGSHCGGSQGCGTVFEVTTSGRERVVYSFNGGSSGRSPGSGPLLDAKGTLYGTTDSTVFEVTTSGTETRLHRFTGSNGAVPTALLNVDGVLYGTTSYSGPGDTGNGTVFSLLS